MSALGNLSVNSNHDYCHQQEQCGQMSREKCGETEHSHIQSRLLTEKL